MAGSRSLRALSIGLMARLELAVLNGHKQPEAMADIRRGRSGRESLLSGNESFMLHSLARAQAGLGGDMAEVGVYQGCSAKIISLASGGRPLYLFDTFAGLPQPAIHEHARLRTGDYAASLASVRHFLAECDNVTFHPGFFPDTAAPAAAHQFSFVHLDVDLYASTLACLTFFYPRLLPGGVILTHDYSYLQGVRHAFDSFLRDKREHAIELPTSQAMLVKR